jgi:hypothetical protein
MESWNDFFDKILKELDRLEEEELCYVPFFRGECNNENPLLPTLFKLEEGLSLENNLYREFISYSALLHPYDIRSSNSWEILYEMRHHGIPTRLLDWTGNFGVALFFALNGNITHPCIWILNPFELNRKSLNYDGIVVTDSDDKRYDYETVFIKKDQKIGDKIITPFYNPIAMYPLKSHPRILAQDGYFTVQGTNAKPMNKIYRKCLKKFDIPKSCISDAQRFLKLININDFSLFPDLDGLSRHMKKKYDF